jgi:hypothetical protein
MLRLLTEFESPRLVPMYNIRSLFSPVDCLRDVWSKRITTYCFYFFLTPRSIFNTSIIWLRAILIFTLFYFLLWLVSKLLITPARFHFNTFLCGATIIYVCFYNEELPWNQWKREWTMLTHNLESNFDPVRFNLYQIKFQFYEEFKSIFI